MRNQPTLLAFAAFLLATAPGAAQPIVNSTRLTIQTTSLPKGRVGNSYRALITVAGGMPPYTFTATGLPPGFTLDAQGGAIRGQPAENAVGNSNVVVTVTDASKSRVVGGTVSLTLGIDDAESAEVCGQLSLGINASLHGFVPFEAGDAWVTDISSAPLDPDNTAITSASGFAGLHLHHDWSSVDGGNYGIPYMVVDSSTTPMVPINVIDYADQSDVAVAPFPINAPIEAEPADCSGWPDDYVGDSHVLVIDRRTCMLYETFNTHRCHGAWNSSSETIWDLKHYQNRPWGWTSGDAAGLPIMPGLIRYDEIVAGEIKHAIRFTMQVTKNDANDGYFVEPATHAAGVYWGVSNVMGMRIRLNKNFDISPYSKTNQIILTAMRKYGMILADNGGYFFFQGVPDPRWSDDDLLNLDAIPSSNFEVVKMSPVWPGWDSASAPTGTVPVIQSFTASATSVKAGASVTLQWNTTGDSYLFIDQAGGVRGGSVTVKPQKSTTYTLNATNQYGRVTKAVTVRVN
jgi:Putative Ig domain